LADAANGVATVWSTLWEDTVEITGKVTKQRHPMAVHARIASDGQMVSGSELTVGGSGAAGPPGTSEFTPILPDHAVKPGDSWSRTYEQANPFGEGTLHVSVSGSLVSVEPDDSGHDVALIKTSATVPLDLTIDAAKVADSMDLGRMPAKTKIAFSGSIDATGFSWVDVPTQQLLKSTTDAHFHLKMTIRGAEPEVPDGTVISIDGSVQMGLTQTSAPTLTV